MNSGFRMLFLTLLVAGGTASVSLGQTNYQFAPTDLSENAPPLPGVPGLDGNRHRLAEVGEPMLVVPFVSEPLARTLTSAGWSWADGCGNFDLRAEGVVLRQRSTTSAPRAKDDV